MSTYEISKKRLKELAELAKMPDEQIDCSDIPETDEEFWKNAKLVMPEPKPKHKPISLKIDPTVYEWFKKQGKGYQTRINAVLKFYVQAHAAKR